MATVQRFVCDVPGCGKSFDTQEAYSGHQGFHKLEGTYPCPECAADGITRVFTLPQGLGSHRRAAHGFVGAAAKNVRLREKRREAGRPEKSMPERATDVPPVTFKVVQVPPGVTRMGQEAPPPLPVKDPTAPLSPITDAPAFVAGVEAAKGTNGTDPIEAEIRAAFAPLVSRYQSLQSRQIELMTEMEHNSHDLEELWKVLGLGVDLSVDLTPPPMQLGVQVAFQKKVSDSLRERGEEWLSLRKQSFTPSDMARSMGISGSTALNLVNEFRDEAKVRLVGKRGRSKTYVSTIGAR